MRLYKFLQEEITTSTVNSLDADSVTSNKLIKVELRDDKIKSLVNKLKKKKNITVTMQVGIATIDMPYEVPKNVMKQLSSYTV